MRREILISATPHESRVALLEEGRVVEFMFDRPDQGRSVGDICLGRVEAVLPGIQASFVDTGTEKAGFLHVSDVPLDDDDADEDADDGADSGEDDRERDRERDRPRGRGRGGSNGKGGNAKGSGRRGGGRTGRGRRRDRKYPPIQELLSKGDTVLVQVTKEPIGTKGPRLTRQISLPGRFIVYMPFSARVGVSRKIEARDERSRLRKLAKGILPRDSGGIIIRTVGEDFTRESFEREFQGLRDTWLEIQKQAETATPPQQLHSDAKLVSGVIRDLFSGKFERLAVDSESVYDEIRRYLQGVDPDLVPKVQLYRGEVPLFDKFEVEEQVQEAFQRKVDLPSGGHIVVEPTEALVSIDVNTGRFTGKKDPEATILKTNLDAAREIARQLRLRDIGGIVVCDFIDMDSQKNRDRVLHELRSHLGRDRARTKTFEVSELGLVEMTRQRIRPSLFQTLTEQCPQCGGKGRVYSPATVLRRVERALSRLGAEGKERSVKIRTHPEVALYWLESEPDFVERLSGRIKVRLEVLDDPLLNHDEFRLLAGPAETDVTQRYVMEA